MPTPPRPIDPATHSDDMEWIELSGRGTLAAFTSVYIGTSAMIDAGYDRKKPYVAGVVELEEGPRISAQILGLDAAAVVQVLIGLVKPELADSVITPTQRELFPMLRNMVATPQRDRENAQWQFGYPVPRR